MVRCVIVLLFVAVVRSDFQGIPIQVLKEQVRVRRPAQGHPGPGVSPPNPGSGGHLALRDMQPAARRARVHGRTRLMKDGGDEM